MYKILILTCIQFTILLSDNISSIKVEGNKKTKDYIILREIKQGINKPWTSEGIAEDKNSIKKSLMLIIL